MPSTFYNRFAPIAALHVHAQEALGAYSAALESAEGAACQQKVTPDMQPAAFPSQPSAATPSMSDAAMQGGEHAGTEVQQAHAHISGNTQQHVAGAPDAPAPAAAAAAGGDAAGIGTTGAKGTPTEVPAAISRRSSHDGASTSPSAATVSPRVARGRSGTPKRQGQHVSGSPRHGPAGSTPSRRSKAAQRADRNSPGGSSTCLLYLGETQQPHMAGDGQQAKSHPHKGGAGDLLQQASPRQATSLQQQQVEAQLQQASQRLKQRMEQAHMDMTDRRLDGSSTGQSTGSTDSGDSEGAGAPCSCVGGGCAVGEGAMGSVDLNNCTASHAVLESGAHQQRPGAAQQSQGMAGTTVQPTATTGTQPHTTCHSLGMAAGHGQAEEAAAAAAAANTAVAAEARNAMAALLTDLGTKTKASGGLEEAAQLYHRALMLQPNYAPAYYNLGVLHSEAKQFDMAVEWYAKAVALHPSYAEAHCNMGVIYKVSGLSPLQCSARFCSRHSMYGQWLVCYILGSLCCHVLLFCFHQMCTNVRTCS